MSNQIKSTNFESDLNQKEQKNLHRSALKQKILSYYPKVKKSDINFYQPQTNLIDDILVKEKKEFGFEYKTDYKAYETNNIVFEIVTYLNIIFLKNINCVRICKQSKHFGKLINIIDKVNNGEIYDGKISRHFGKESNIWMSYIVLNQKVNIQNHFVFTMTDLNNFVLKNYSNGDLIITKTKNKQNKEWNTISWLVPIEKIKKISK